MIKSMKIFLLITIRRQQDCQFIGMVEKVCIIMELLSLALCRGEISSCLAHVERAPVRIPSTAKECPVCIHNIKWSK